jgi:hypothetical protein
MYFSFFGCFGYPFGQIHANEVTKRVEYSEYLHYISFRTRCIDKEKFIHYYLIHTYLSFIQVSKKLILEYIS